MRALTSNPRRTALEDWLVRANKIIEDQEDRHRKYLRLRPTLERAEVYWDLPRTAQIVLYRLDYEKLLNFDEVIDAVDAYCIKNGENRGMSADEVRDALYMLVANEMASVTGVI